MKIGTFSYFLKEIEVIKIENKNPLLVSETKTEVLSNSSMKIDELYIWGIEKDTKEYFINSRGSSGY